MDPRFGMNAIWWSYATMNDLIFIPLMSRGRVPRDSHWHASSDSTEHRPVS